jgi:hypothetical protein
LHRVSAAQGNIRGNYMRIDQLLCEKILLAIESDPNAGTGQSLNLTLDGYEQPAVAHHVKRLFDDGMIAGIVATHNRSPFPEILVLDLTPDGRRLLEKGEPERDAIKIEERSWDNWVAVAKKTRDERLRELVARCAKDGAYQSGGRLKEDLKIIFASIEDVVTNAVAMRRTLVAEIPVLASARSLAALKSRTADFINSGVSQMDDQMSKTTRDLSEGTHRAIHALAHAEINILLDRVSNDLDSIRLESKLNSKKQERSQITIHVSGNSNNINLGNVLGDLNGSVQMLNEGNQKDIADAITGLGRAIQESAELNDESRREYLEHLTTVSEQVAKPPDQRRLATFTTAISTLGSIASVASKVAPLYHQLLALLTEHHILDK